MKAIQYSKLGGPEVLEFKTVPDPACGPNDIVMRVKAAAINHIDIHYRRGLPGVKTPLPHIPGSDGAGIVEAAGANVTNVNIGDRILMNPNYTCEVCDFCLSGEENLCTQRKVIGEDIDGTYAELVRIPAKNAYRIPNHVSFENAAATPLVYLTAWSMLMKASLKPGNTLLVASAGSGVSTAAIQMAKLLGVYVFATTSTEEKMERAKTLGADEVINYTVEDVDRAIRKRTNKRGVDAVLDHLGGKFWIPHLRSIRNGGTLVTCGATLGYEPTEDLRQIFFRQVRVVGSTMGSRREFMDVLSFLFSGKITPAIDRTFPLQNAAEAHTIIENKKTFGKIILIQ